MEASLETAEYQTGRANVTVEKESKTREIEKKEE